MTKNNKDVILEENKESLGVTRKYESIKIREPMNKKENVCNKLTQLEKIKEFKLTNDHFNNLPYNNTQFTDSALYTKVFMDKIKSVLGLSSTFAKATKEARIKILEKVKKVSKFRFVAKKVTGKESELALVHNNKQEYEFCLKFEELVEQRNKNSNINQKFFRVKLRKSMSLMLKFLKEQATLPQKYANLMEDDEFFTKFLTILKRSKKKIYLLFLDKFINLCFHNSTRELNSQIPQLTAKKYDLAYQMMPLLITFFYKTFIKTICEYFNPKGHFLRELEKKGIYLLQLDHLIEKQYDFYKRLYNPLYQLLTLFTDSTVKIAYKSRPTFFAGGKVVAHSNISYELPVEFASFLPVGMHLPDIVPVPDWNELGQSEGEANILNEILPEKLVNSSYKVSKQFSFSKQTIRSLNIVQTKHFKINEKYLHLLEMEDRNRNIGVKNKFPTYAQIVFQKNKVFEIHGALTKFLKVKEKAVHLNSKLLKFNTLINCDDEMKGTLNLAKLKIQGVSCLEIEFQKLRILNAKRQIFLSVTKMAQIYVGFPIYYKASCDYRLRMYPKTWLFNRTSGVYKYLLCDYQKKVLTVPGFFHLLEAYYWPDKKKLKIFQEKFSTTSSKSHMFTHFLKNLADYEHVKNKLYFKLLEREILDLEDLDNQKSDILIEIDQKGSCGVFLSLLLRNKSLAYYSNLSINKPLDLSGYLQDQTAEFFENKKFFKLGKENCERILDFFLKFRGAHKMAFMSFCYSQQEYGRFQVWVEQFTERYGECPSNKERIILRKFSKKYTFFLDTVFPNLITQLDKFLAIVEYFLEKNYNVKLLTLDGSTISWTFPAYEAEKVTFTALSAEKFLHAQVYLLRDKKKIDMLKSKKSVLAGIVHSIDAGFLRLLVLNFNQETKYILNPNHDSIQIHPNYVGDLYKSLNKLYLSDVFDNMAEKLIFGPMRADLSDNDKIEFDILVQDFHNSSDEFRIDEKNFNIKNVYEYE